MSKSNRMLRQVEVGPKDLPDLPDVHAILDDGLYGREIISAPFHGINAAFPPIEAESWLSLDRDRQQRSASSTTYDY